MCTSCLLGLGFTRTVVPLLAFPHVGQGVALFEVTFSLLWGSQGDGEEGTKDHGYLASVKTTN